MSRTSASYQLGADGVAALTSEEALCAIACQYATFTCRHAGIDDERLWLWLAAALASQAVEESHVCIDLPRLYEAGTHWPSTAASSSDGLPASVQLPPLDEWLRFLREDCAMVVGRASVAPEVATPLVLDEDGRLYLHRYFLMERRLAEALLRMNDKGNPPVPAIRAESDAKVALAKMFPHEDEPNWETNWPKIAAFSALQNRLTVITGGPGTGKTSVVGKLVLLIRDLCAESGSQGSLKVKLAAPTGKAAARLGQGLDECFEKLKRDGDYPVSLDGVDRSASTLHRLLGYQRHSIHFRHNAGNPLDADLIIVDEASMVTLPQMLRLVDAVPKGARLILLGDMKQLASIESGFVLGDLCEAMQPKAFTEDFRQRFSTVASHPRSDAIPSHNASASFALSDACVELAYSWRFRPGSHIDRVSEAINNEDGAGALAEPSEPKTGFVTELNEWRNPGILQPLSKSESADWDNASPPRTHVWHRCNIPNFLLERGKPVAAFVEAECIHLHGRYREFLMMDAGKPQDVLDAFERFRILCATRTGPHGVTALNMLVESVLGLDYASDRTKERGRLDSICLPASSRRRTHYDHRPILITQNNYGLDLFNGDTGVILANPKYDPKDEDKKHLPRLLAWFPAAADAVKGAPPRCFVPEMLPAHETAWAMTIHKSQGSQYDDVLVVLPHRDNPVVGRELIYTAITRAKRRAELWLPPENALFGSWVARSTDRHSGLVDALRR